MTIGVIFHVEGLGLYRVSVNQHGFVKMSRDNSFLPTSEVFTPREGFSSIFQDLHGLIIADDRKRGLNPLKRGNISLQEAEFRLTGFENLLDDGHDHGFCQGHDGLQISKRNFRLDHPKLGKVPAGFRLFRTKSGATAINLAKSHSARLHVKLPALRQKGLVVPEIVSFKKG